MIYCCCYYAVVSCQDAAVRAGAILGVRAAICPVDGRVMKAEGQPEAITQYLEQFFRTHA